jgi:hypothetical protein
MLASRRVGGRISTTAPSGFAAGNRLSQAAARRSSLSSRVPQLPEASCPIEQRETLLHRLSQEVARRAAAHEAVSQAAEAEREAPLGACRPRMAAEPRRSRTLLLRLGPRRFPRRRYRCPACGAWRCPAAQRLGLTSRPRMTQALQEGIAPFGRWWSYSVAAVLLGRGLPLWAVRAKTVERVTQRSAPLRQQGEDAAGGVRGVGRSVPDAAQAVSRARSPGTGAAGPAASLRLPGAALRGPGGDPGARPRRQPMAGSPGRQPGERLRGTAAPPASTAAGHRPHPGGAGGRMGEVRRAGVAGVPPAGRGLGSGSRGGRTGGVPAERAQRRRQPQPLGTLFPPLPGAVGPVTPAALWARRRSSSGRGR